MNRNFITIAFLFFVLFGMLAFNTSCIDENTEDCGEVNIRFNYSYNILSVNAFESQANEVSLYVFDKASRRLIFQETASQPKLPNDFSFRTNELDAGDYIFAAWAQGPLSGSNGESYVIPELVIGSSTIDDLTYFIKRIENTVHNQLNNLLVGVTNATITNSIQDQWVVVDLKKVNRNVRVVLLPYTSGTDLDVKNYEFSIVDKTGNGKINYDFSLLPDTEITYFPFFEANSKPASSEQLEEDEIDRAVVAEIKTSRIVEENNPKLIIKALGNNTTLASISLPWLFSLTSMESHSEWSLQEYLDRQDQFSVTLFINNDAWMSNTIIINGWVINNVPVEM